jgi:hypothetical protein
MNIARLIQTSLTLTLYAILTACGGGSSPTTAGSQSASSAYQRPTRVQNTSEAEWPNGSSCSQLDRHTTLQSTKVKASFPPDCGVTGNIQIAGVTNLSSPPEFAALCENSNPITGDGERRGCNGSESDANCQQANSTFWYETITFLGGGGAHPLYFDKSTFPVKFSSSAFITPGNLYGLCVLYFGEGGTETVQDDFADGHAVAPSGDTIHLKLMLPEASYNTVHGLDVFFESKPVSS